MPVLFEGEKNIVQRAQKGDKVAFDVLYQAHGPAIRRFIVLQGVSPADADDVLQTIFIKVWKNIPKFTWHDHGISAWIYQIARTVIIDHFRSSRITESLDMVAEAGDRGSAIESITNVVDRSFARDRVLLALEKLDPDDRMLVSLRYAEDRDSSEIAEIMGISGPAVRKRLSRVLAKLRSIITE